jgi:hypothetical protein
LLCLFFGLQLPFSPADLPGTGSNPGQQCCAEDGFFVDAFPAEDFFFVAIGILEAFRAAVLRAGGKRLSCSRKTSCRFAS